MSLICWSSSAPSYRMLHDGIPAASGPARSSCRCRPACGSAGDRCYGPAADRREVGRVGVAGPNAMTPPLSSGPWQRTQPTPELVLLAEELDRRAAARDRVGPQRLLLVEVRGRARRSQVSGTHTTKNATSTTPQPWSFWSSGVSRAGVGGPRPHRAEGCRAAAARDPAPQDERGDGQHHEHAAEDEEHHRPRTIAQRQHRRRDLFLPGATQKGPCGGSPMRVGPARRAQDDLGRVDHHVAVRRSSRGSGPSRGGPGPAGTRPRRCTSSRGRGTRTTSTSRRTARGSPGARTAGTAA